MLFDASWETVKKKLENEYINTSNMPIEVISLFYVSGVAKVCTEALKDSNNFDSKKLLNYIDQLLPDVDYLIPKK